MTIADYLTLGRIIVAPIVFILFLQDNSTAKVVAFVLFSLGAISDTLDGYIARRTKLSDFGKLWDPIADKLLTGLALVALSILGILPWWIAAGLVLRDIVVTAVRIAKIKSEGKIILPVLAAKLKT
ncbi:MAG TPA: CDP-diacylglycerol--glycerol-3-phosphate 3-phosphatidyltransferase, partial [candidate division Zixibacteria bacterium]|nr:CDP-diacylglycerol--glycerol-3-phosphate 3-phosphatidyltransferase [candidate division Zixibacteria bacterium]